MEREAEARRVEALQRKANAEHEEAARRDEVLRRKTEHIFDCPCGFSGKAKLEKRGNIGIVLILSCLCIVPGLLYGLWTVGYKALCPNCGRVLAEEC
jgi:hypothetical protein